MRRLVRKSKPLQAALLSLSAIAATLVIASPAQAASSYCKAPLWYTSVRQCTTATVSANVAGQYIDVHRFLCQGASWKVWDVNSGAVVARGTSTGRYWQTSRIHGLYGYYKAQISYTCAYDEVGLTNS